MTSGGVLGLPGQRGGDQCERGERPQQRDVAERGGVQGAADRPERAGAGGHRARDGRDRAVGARPVEVGDRGGARQGGHAVAHPEQHEPGDHGAGGVRADDHRDAEGDEHEHARGRRRPWQPGGERCEQQPAGDLRDADQADGERCERRRVAAFEQERDRVHRHRERGQRGEHERAGQQPERGGPQRLAGRDRPAAVRGDGRGMVRGRGGPQHERVQRAR